jgi:hypothetical protein
MEKKVFKNWLFSAGVKKSIFMSSYLNNIPKLYIFVGFILFFRVKLFRESDLIAYLREMESLRGQEPRYSSPLPSPPI